MTCALVRIRLPLMTVPLPVISDGDCLVQGLLGSGARTVENTLTTASSTDFEGVTASEAPFPGLASGDGAGETGSAKATSSSKRRISKRKYLVMPTDTSAFAS